MKTKLLRNLRVDAYKEYGIKKKIDLPKTGFGVLEYNFIWDYKNGKFGEDLTLQQAIDKYFKEDKQ